MITILAASALGSWTYDSFLAEPAANPAPTPPPASAPLVPVTPKKVEKPIAKAKPPESPVSEKAPTTPPPPAAAPKVAAPPTLYRLSDASGQAWEHRDPTYLASYVESRNRSFSAYSPASPATYTTVPAQGYRSSRCYNGRCN